MKPTYGFELNWKEVKAKLEIKKHKRTDFFQMISEESVFLIANTPLVRYFIYTLTQVFRIKCILKNTYHARYLQYYIWNYRLG